MAQALAEGSVVQVLQGAIEECRRLGRVSIGDEVSGKQALVLECRQTLLKLTAGLQGLCWLAPSLVHTDQRGPGAIVRPAIVSADQLIQEAHRFLGGAGGKP